MKRAERHSSSIEFNIWGLRIPVLSVVTRCSFLEDWESKGSPVTSSHSLPGTIYLYKTANLERERERELRQGPTPSLAPCFYFSYILNITRGSPMSKATTGHGSRLKHQGFKLRKTTKLENL